MYEEDQEEKQKKLEEFNARFAKINEAEGRIQKLDEQYKKTQEQAQKLQETAQAGAARLDEAFQKLQDAIAEDERLRQEDDEKFISGLIKHLQKAGDAKLGEGQTEVYLRRKFQKMLDRCSMSELDHMTYAKFATKYTTELYDIPKGSEEYLRIREALEATARERMEEDDRE